MFVNMLAMKIENRIINLLKKSVGGMSTSVVASQLGVSRSYASTILSKMERDGILERRKEGKEVIYSKIDTEIILNEQYFVEGAREDQILFEVRRHSIFRKMVKEQARSAFEFAFPEMINNAIEHSGSNDMNIVVEIEDEILRFTVRDWGMGVFKNIKDKLDLERELDAIGELMKGKRTTAPRAHSGMGIFFTSKIADRFWLKSYGLEMEVNNKVQDIFVREVEDNAPLGTEVVFEIDVNSKKSVSETFRSYSLDPDEGAFDRTEILVKLYKLGTIYVSRSQARALLVGLDKFRKVVLDFEGVSDIGQAFADEIFRVFKIAHPEVEIEFVNANDAVRFMIKMAKSEADKV